jgi:glucose/arabinose dehydrogenase
VANNNSVVRFPYRNGDLKARGDAQMIVPHLADGTGGHSTRDVAFSRDGKRLFISVGSGSNVAETMAKKSFRTFPLGKRNTDWARPGVRKLIAPTFS